MDRRHFLKATSTAFAGLVAVPLLQSAVLAKRPLFQNVGLQLWSVKDLLDSNPHKLFETLASIGFKHVELPMFVSIPEIYSAAKASGIYISGAHFPLAYATQNWLEYKNNQLPVTDHSSFEDLLQEAITYKIPFLTLPYLFNFERKNLISYYTLADSLNDLGEKSQRSGVQLCYHMHHHEFETINGTRPIDVLLENTNTDLVSFEIDTFWLAMSGIDITAFIKMHLNRIKLLHLKDIKAINKEPFQKEAGELTDTIAIPGKGLINFKEISKLARKSRIKYSYLELEGPLFNNLEAIQTSFDYLS